MDDEIEVLEVEDADDPQGIARPPARWRRPVVVGLTALAAAVLVGVGFAAGRANEAKGVVSRGCAQWSARVGAEAQVRAVRDHNPQSLPSWIRRIASAPVFDDGNGVYIGRPAGCPSPAFVPTGPDALRCNLSVSATEEDWRATIADAAIAKAARICPSLHAVQARIVPVGQLGNRAVVTADGGYCAAFGYMYSSGRGYAIQGGGFGCPTAATRP